MLLIKNGYLKTMAGPDLENGSVLIGDDAVIWTDNPLTTVGAEAAVTVVDGKIVYQKS